MYIPEINDRLKIFEDFCLIQIESKILEIILQKNPKRNHEKITFYKNYLITKKLKSLII
jgi:hypothetical protein